MKRNTIYLIGGLAVAAVLGFVVYKKFFATKDANGQEKELTDEDGGDLKDSINRPTKDTNASTSVKGVGKPKPIRLVQNTKPLKTSVTRDIGGVQVSLEVDSAKPNSSKIPLDSANTSEIPLSNQEFVWKGTTFSVEQLTSIGLAIEKAMKRPEYINKMAEGKTMDARRLVYNYKGVGGQFNLEAYEAWKKTQVSNFSEESDFAFNEIIF